MYKCSQGHGVILECPAWGRRLDSVILVGPFQLGMFYDSMNYKNQVNRICSRNRTGPVNLFYMYTHKTIVIISRTLLIM